jgi:hypothetical protein
MTILLIHGSKTHTAAQELLTRWANIDQAALVLEIDSRLARPPAAPVMRFATYESYLDEAALAAVDEAAMRFASAWYRSDGRDITRLNGRSVGADLARNVFVEMVLVFKNIECAHRILTSEPVTHIYIGEGVSVIRRAWQAAARAHNITSTLLPLDIDAKPPTTPPPPLWHKVQQRVLQGFREIMHERTVPVTPPPHALTVAIHKGRPTCAAWFRQVRAQPAMHALTLRAPPTAASIITSGLTFWRMFWRWRRYRSHPPTSELYTYRGVPLWPCWQPRAAHVLTRRIPRLHDGIQRTVHWIARQQVRGIVITWHEVHTQPQLYPAAQQAGIPLIVLQDSWLPGAYFPTDHRHLLRMHHLLVWGEIAESWRERLPGTQVHIAGHPHGQQAATPAAPTHSRPANRPLTVLLTHQCWGRWSAFHSPLDTNDMLTALAAAARALPDIQFLLKIHPLVDVNETPDTPGWSRRSDELFDWVNRQALPNLTALPLRGTVQASLEGVDLLVTYYSLTALEALAQGVPVVMLNLSGKRDLLPELVAPMGAPALRSEAEFISFVRELRDGQRTLNAADLDIAAFFRRAYGDSRDVGALVRQLIR